MASRGPTKKKGVVAKPGAAAGGGKASSKKESTKKKGVVAKPGAAAGGGKASGKESTKKKGVVAKPSAAAVGGKASGKKESTKKKGVVAKPGGAAAAGGKASGKGYIYLIRQGETNYFKYGRTEDPVDRLSKFRTGNPHKLNMTKRSVNNMSAAEQELKEEIKKLKDGTAIGGGTEWFHVPECRVEEVKKKLDNVAQRINRQY